MASRLQALDFELTPSYRFLVQVSDGGTPSLSSFADVEVHVRDVNDQVPVFSKVTYDVTLFLPAFPGTKVATVEALDGDSAGVTRLEYSLASSHLNGTFELDAKRGVVTLKNADDIRPGVEQIKVSVSDGKFSTSSFLKVSVQPLPSGKLKFRQASYTTSVLEGPSIDEDILAVQNVGYPLGETLSYTIVNPSDLFVINPSTGVVRTVQGGEFDREKIDRYVVVVQARGSVGGVPSVAQAPVHVTVQDINDNRPLFAQRSYFFVAQKGGRLGAWVGQVSATDADIDSNGEIR